MNVKDRAPLAAEGRIIWRGLCLILAPLAGITGGLCFAILAMVSGVEVSAGFWWLLAGIVLGMVGARKLFLQAGLGRYLWWLWLSNVLALPFFQGMLVNYEHPDKSRLSEVVNMAGSFKVSLHDMMIAEGARISCDADPVLELVAQLEQSDYVQSVACEASTPESLRFAVTPAAENLDTKLPAESALLFEYRVVDRQSSKMHCRGRDIPERLLVGPCKP